MDERGQSQDALAQMKAAWWYYTVEMSAGDVIQGVYSDELPFPPRIVQRRVDFSGMDCLDIGSAEGLLPILCKKNGARKVVATDNLAYGFYEKLRFLQNLHGAEMEFQEIFRAEEVHLLAGKYPEGFDFINLSGVLYHVSSPLDAIASARALLKPNGIMEIATIAIFKPGCFMEFNDRGRLQPHYNVFWYVSVGFLEYAMRLCSLEPIDVEFIEPGEDRFNYVTVLARATDQPAAVGDDTYPKVVRDFSEEFRWLRNINLQRSEIRTRNLSQDLAMHPGTDQVDIWATVNSKPCLPRNTRHQDSRVFMLSDME
ncbi:methyltransferase domain-containing protein [[Pseudomonas] carboxydohydrogena]|uniref:Methyltransferase domain-containing protein n=1 Tax=Afipia carboxydohydrogena TaxID=290 RepID=A0ABY8BSX9_AFICR|nr:methyltransferase domain-containing protein [[Pseudomonas] carboxydohydrogena]WEF53088.1 methyltransferase domain-containing protein [[Pseudomonas] carboxydohydrogena]